MPAAPFARVDHLVIAVRDLVAAERAYAALLGREPSTRGAHPGLGTTNVVFGLANCYLELLALDGTPPSHPLAHGLAAFLEGTPEGILALALGSDDLDETARALRAAGTDVGTETTVTTTVPAGGTRATRLLPIAREHTRGVNVFAVQHAHDVIPPAPWLGDPAAGVAAVDHVVLFSDDLDGALRLWRDAFAIPERWRREFTERGTVNVGLRLGGITLELVAPLGAAAGERGERLWGIAYTVEDGDAAVARLRAQGGETSDARPGLAPGTRVATVKWRDRLPTLLIQHTSHTRHTR
ncbi:MAG TPA: VOC family protein [Candidatus Binatia bacterium]|jgi:catechol 2,3-dioxygenase-like lactoylglutathione lyase family enzyme